jgi:hypothetical protein
MSDEDDSMQRASEWIPRPSRATADPEEQRLQNNQRAVERRRGRTREQELRDNWQASQHRQRDFIPLLENFDDTNAWQVTYGGLHTVAHGIANDLPYESDRALFAAGVPLHVPWGKVRLYPAKQSDHYISGGELRYNSNRIFDVRPFFMQAAERTYAQYGTTDLVEIMNRARTDLASVGLRAFQNNWFRNSSLANQLLHDMKITGIPDVPTPHLPASPTQCMGSVACGYIPGPIYEYDLVSAFASALLGDEVQHEGLKEYVRRLDQYRHDLAGTPSAHLIKVTQTVLPGKMLAQVSRYERRDYNRSAEKWHNEGLGKYCRAVTRRKLLDAMRKAVERYGIVFRWYIDGFYTNVDISDVLDLSGILGSWKMTVHDYLLIVQTSVFKTNLKSRTNGYTDIDWDAVRNDPLRVRAKRTQVNWANPVAPNWLEAYTKTWKLQFEEGRHRCIYCRDGYHLERRSEDQELCWSD